MEHAPILIRTGFLLDNDLNIQFVNPGISYLLSWKPELLLHQPLERFIHDNYNELQDHLRHQLHPESIRDHTIGMNFKTGRGNYIPLICHISYLAGGVNGISRIFMVNFEGLNHMATHMTKLWKKTPRGMIFLLNQNTPLLIRHADMATLEEVRDFVIQHFDENLPSLKQLAKRYQLNEFKLKHGFKLLYGCPIFQYQIRERMKRATFLLRNTSLTAGDIARRIGYTVPHFSEAFKKTYGCSPIAFRQLSVPYNQVKITPLPRVKTPPQ